MDRVLSRTRPRHRPSVRAWLSSRIALYRQRRHLDALEDHLLDDIGLTRAEASQEAARPVWDAPDNWRI